LAFANPATNATALGNSMDHFAPTDPVISANPRKIAVTMNVEYDFSERSLDFTPTEQKTDPKKYLTTVLRKRFGSHFWVTGSWPRKKLSTLGE
jgi:hypothetical protein